MAEMGLRILYVGNGAHRGEHVPQRDRAKYLREHYWLRFAPWPGLSSGHTLGRYRLQRKDFGREAHGPGDSFWFYADSEGPRTGLQWTEVTEVYESEDVAKQVNAFIRTRLSIPMSPKSRKIDIRGFESAMDMSLPSADREKNMMDRVKKRIEEKLEKYGEVGMGTELASRHPVGEESWTIESAGRRIHLRGTEHSNDTDDEASRGGCFHVTRAATRQGHRGKSGESS